METLHTRSYITLTPALTFFLSLTFVLFLTLTSAFSNSVLAQGQENYENDSLVGRILYIEGQLLRYVPEEDDWIKTMKDTPFGVFDVLYSSGEAKVEIIMPNNTLVRIGGNTQIQLIRLKSEVTEIDLSSGTARLYNKSTFSEIKVTTPFGEVIMPPETVCEIFVNETQVELVSLKGAVDFSQEGSDAHHEVLAGSSSIIATSDQVIASAHSVSPKWDAWNTDRDVQWTQRVSGRGDSEKYLPKSLQDEAHELEKNGRWERVYYQGAYNYFWRPAYVSVGWTPFSSGCWITWHGEETWVPYESFGYVTHHYGNWVYAGNHWYWAPPVSRVMVSAGYPLLNIGISWYPGRVAWLYSGISIGWIPLSPFETYYSYNYWGPRSRVRHHNYYYDYDRYRYRHYRHARFIDCDHFYGSGNYRHAGLRKMRKGEKFKGSAYVPMKIKNNYKRKNRLRFVSNNPKFKNILSEIDGRRKKTDKRIRMRLTGPSFKPGISKSLNKNQSAIKKIVDKRSRTITKNRKLVKNRIDSVKKNVSKGIHNRKDKRNRIARVNTEKWNESINKTQKFSLKRQINPNRYFVKTRNRSDKKILSNSADKKFLSGQSNQKSRSVKFGPIFKHDSSNLKQKTNRFFSKYEKQRHTINRIAREFKDNRSNRSARIRNKLFTKK